MKSLLEQLKRSLKNPFILFISLGFLIFSGLVIGYPSKQKLSLLKPVLIGIIGGMSAKIITELE